MQSAARRQRNQSIVTILVIICCIGAIATLQIPQLQQIVDRSETATAADIRQEVAAEKLRLDVLANFPSFGFNNLIADWTFLNFLQYFGDDVARSKTDYRLSPDYFEIIVKQDPNFLAAYTFASTSTALYAGMPEKSVALMKQGLQSLKPNVPPGSYYVWRQLGIDQLLFLGDAQAARQSFETAAAWARTSALPGSTGVASISQQTADFLARNPNSKSAQVAAWTMVLSSAPDEQTQKIAVDRITDLGGKVIENPDGTVSVQAPKND